MQLNVQLELYMMAPRHPPGSSQPWHNRSMIDKSIICWILTRSPFDANFIVEDLLMQSAPARSHPIAACGLRPGGASRTGPGCRRRARPIRPGAGAVLARVFSGPPDVAVNSGRIGLSQHRSASALTLRNARSAGRRLDRPHAAPGDADWHKPIVTGIRMIGLNQ